MPGLVFTAFGAWLLYESGRLDVILARDVGGGMNAATYPRLLAAAMLVSGLGLIGHAVVRRRSTGGAAVHEERAGNLPIRAAAGLFAFFMYAALLEPLGFLVATSLLLVALLLTAGERRALVLLTAPLAMTLVVQAITRFAFDIVLPRGVLRLLPF